MADPCTINVTVPGPAAVDVTVPTAPSTINVTVPASPIQVGVTVPGPKRVDVTVPSPQVVTVNVGQTIQTVFDDNFLNVKSFGATGDGVTDDSAAFIAARDAMIATINRPDATNQTLLINEQRIQKGIYIPPGDYLITQADALFLDTGEGNVRGYTLQGQSITNTNIIFRPTVAAALFNVVSSMMFGTIRDIRFASDAVDGGGLPIATFFEATGVQGNQGQLFERCEWKGLWKKVFHLNNSTDNGSEMTWNNCRMELWAGTHSFLHVEGTDQQLFYTFENCFYWSRCPMCIMDKGGQIKATNCEFILNDNDATTPTKYYAFELGLDLTNHFDGSIGITIDGMRVEHRTVNCGLFKSGWRGSNISIRHLNNRSMASQVVTFETITLDYGKLGGNDNPGAIFSMSDSELMGWLQVNHDLNYNADGRIKIDTSTFTQESIAGYVKYSNVAPNPQTNITADCRSLV